MGMISCPEVCVVFVCPPIFLGFSFHYIVVVQNILLQHQTSIGRCHFKFKPSLIYAIADKHGV